LDLERQPAPFPPRRIPLKFLRFSFLVSFFALLWDYTGLPSAFPLT
jgi:hypothetical protein